MAIWPACARCQSARDIRRNRTGRRWIEHQPGIVRPRREWSHRAPRCADPANLDFRGHAVSQGSGSAAPACSRDRSGSRSSGRFRLQLRSFEARPAGAFFLGSRRVHQCHHGIEIIQPQATAERARSWVEVRIGKNSSCKPPRCRIIQPRSFQLVAKPSFA